MTKLVNFIINRRIFGNVGIGMRYIALRLIIIIIRYKIFDRILREKLLKLTAKLGSEGFVVCKHKRRTLNLFNDLCNGKGLTGTRHPQKGLLLFAL